MQQVGKLKKIKMKNRKALEVSGFEILITLALLVVFAIIYFEWLKDYRIFTGKLEDYEICKASNIENAKLKLKVPRSNQVLAERGGNKCKTEYVNVPKGKEFDIIAKKMAGCWDQYLEGKEELFETEDNNYCAFCSVLTFEDKKQIKGLTNYLLDNKVSGVTDAAQTRKKYFFYLTRTFVTNDVFNEVTNSHLNELNTIDTSKPLAVIFTMGKNVYPGGSIKMSSVTSAGIGAVAGGAVGGTAVAGLLIKAGVGVCLGIPVAGCTIGSILVGTGIIVGAGTLATTGYMIGSNYNPNLDTKILLWPYTQEDLHNLQCTKLEGKDRLDIKKY